MTAAKKKKIIIAAACVIVIAGVVIAFLLLNRDPKVEEGQKVLMTVTAENMQNVYGYEFKLHYKPEELYLPEDGEEPGTLTSKVEAISTIFSRPIDTYRFVGATMVGDQAGFTGNNQQVCVIEFTAQQGMALSELEQSVSIEDINVVTATPGSDLGWEQGVEGWSFKLSVA